MATQLIDKADLGQVRHDSGYGRVVEVDAPKGRNAQVHIDAEGLRLPITGWIDTTDRALYEAALAAKESAGRVFYLVECHRRGDCTKPLDTPLADLSNMEKVKDVVELTVVDGNGRAIGPVTASTAATAPVNGNDAQVPGDEAPAPTAPSGPPARQDAPGAPTCGLCHRSVAGTAVRKVHGIVQHVECPAADAPAPDDAASSPDPVDPSPTSTDTTPPTWPCPLECGVEPYRAEVALVDHMRDIHGAELAVTTDPTPTTTGSTTTDGKRGPRIVEPKPWEPYIVLKDGSTAINLGSYAVQAAEGMVLLAHDLLLEKARTASKSDGVPFAPPTPGQLKSLAGRLLRAADLAQAKVRPDGHANRMDGSHTRCRAAVRVALEAFPVPWGADRDELDQWTGALADYAAVIVSISRELYVDVDQLP